MKHIKVLLDDQEMATSERSESFLRFPYCHTCRPRRRTTPMQVQLEGASDWVNAFICTSCNNMYWADAPNTGDFIDVLGDYDEMRWAGIPHDEMGGLLDNETRRASGARPSAGRNPSRVGRRSNRDDERYVEDEVRPVEREVLLDERDEPDIQQGEEASPDEYIRQLQDRLDAADQLRREQAEEVQRNRERATATQAAIYADATEPDPNSWWVDTYRLVVGGRQPSVRSSAPTDRDVGLEQADYIWIQDAGTVTVRNAEPGDEQADCDCQICTNYRERIRNAER